jgi:drug/metabolite transporter (DMT)-like permease
MTDRRSAARLWAALLIVYLVWGSTYLAIRVVVQGGLPPLLGMGARFLLAAPLLAAFVALRSGLGRLRIARRELLASAAVGTLLVAMGNGMVAVAEQTVPSGLAALLIASVPLLMVALRLTRRDMLTRHDHRITPTLKSNKPFGYLVVNKIAKKAITVTIQNAIHKKTRMM